MTPPSRREPPREEAADALAQQAARVVKASVYANSSSGWRDPQAKDALDSTILLLSGALAAYEEARDSASDSTGGQK